MPSKIPTRREPPDALKTAICIRQGRKCAITGDPLKSIHHAEFNHDPPLGNRKVNRRGTDWIPKQHDPEHLFAVLPGAHKERTNGPNVEKKHMLAKNHDKASITKATRISGAGPNGKKTKRGAKCMPERPLPPRRNPLYRDA